MAGEDSNQGGKDEGDKEDLGDEYPNAAKEQNQQEYKEQCSNHGPLPFLTSKASSLLTSTLNQSQLCSNLCEVNLVYESCRVHGGVRDILSPFTSRNRLL